MQKKLKSPLQESRPLGKIHSKNALFFRVSVGTAENGKHVYDMDISVDNSSPIVRSHKTGKWFTLTWPEIIDLAVKAGVDKF